MRSRVRLCVSRCQLEGRQPYSNLTSDVLTQWLQRLLTARIPHVDFRLVPASTTTVPFRITSHSLRAYAGGSAAPIRLPVSPLAANLGHSGYPRRPFGRRRLSALIIISGQVRDPESASQTGAQGATPSLNATPLSEHVASSRLSTEPTTVLDTGYLRCDPKGFESPAFRRGHRTFR